MSTKLWCPDCTTQTVVDVMSVSDGFEFTCDDCKQVFYVRIERGLTQAVRRLLMKPKLLDLFCCAGGAGMGYSRAGFDVVGVDIKPQPRYPFEFHQADSLQYLAEHGAEFDFIHASPPCQAYMDTNKGGAKPSKHPRLIEPTRELLHKIGKPFVIENVHLAPLRANLMLCGTMFDLRVIRHRYFECSDPPVFTPYCNHWGSVAAGDFVGVYAFGGRGHRHGKGKRDGPSEPAKVTAAEAMGIDWMKEKELFEAIPPAFTQFIGSHAITRLTPREPDSLKAGDLSLPDVVKSESNLPA